MAKPKVSRYVKLPPCPNIECPGAGSRTKEGKEYVWRCYTCNTVWPRTERFG